MPNLPEPPPRLSGAAGGAEAPSTATDRSKMCRSLSGASPEKAEEPIDPVDGSRHLDMAKPAAIWSLARTNEAAEQMRRVTTTTNYATSGPRLC